jgi:hypothetical protein
MFREVRKPSPLVYQGGAKYPCSCVVALLQ